ncbi:MAG: AAA family ATPase [Acidobacteria bacterium]|nr:AAA family ATPase [Acidobacteriota bacterium]
MADSPITFSSSEVATYYKARVPQFQQREASQWRGACPIHNGKHHSFAVEPTTGRWFCHSACGRGGDILALEAELSGGNFTACKAEVFRIIGRDDSPRGNPKARQAEEGKARKTLASDVRRTLELSGWRLKKEFEFGPELRKVRFEHMSDVQEDKERAEKTYRWEHLEGGKWWSGDGGKQKRLYANRAFWERDQVEIAIGFEGENKVDAAGEMSIAGFSFKELDEESARPLEGSNVVLWPDHDEPGMRMAKARADLLTPIVGSLGLIEPPAELPESGDIIDAVALGWGAKQIRELAARAKPLPRQSADSQDSGVDTEVRPQEKIETRPNRPHQAPLKVHAMDTQFDEPDTAVEPLIEDLLFPGLTLFHAPPKRGKTFLAVQIVHAVVTGTPLENCLIVKKTGPVLYLSEMSQAQSRKRTKAVGMTREDHRQLFFSAVHEMRPWAGGGAEELEATVEAMNPKPVLIVADSLLGIIKAMQSRGSVAVQEYAIVDRFKRISDRFSISILVIHHSRKLKGDAIESAMGTGGIPAACDDVWALARESDGDGILTCEGRDNESRVYRFRQRSGDQGGFWELIESGERAALGVQRRTVLKFVEENPNLNPKQIAERLNMNEKTLGTHLRRLADAGMVRNERTGYIALRGQRSVGG